MRIRPSTVLMVLGTTLALSVNAMSDQQRSVILTTYYPSPRGVYDELRANRYGSVDPSGRYAFNTQTGEVAAAFVRLLDQESGKSYRLAMRNERLVLSDEKTQKNYVLVDINLLSILE